MLQTCCGLLLLLIMMMTKAHFIEHFLCSWLLSSLQQCCEVGTGIVSNLQMRKGRFRDVLLVA